MDYQFKVKFTEAHAMYAVCKFYLRRLNGRFWLALIALVAIVVSQFIIHGLTKSITGALLPLLVIGGGGIAAIYFLTRRHLLLQLQKMGSPEVEYWLSEDGIRASSGLGLADLKWNSFTGLWLFPKVWLLILLNGTYMTLPADQLNEEVKSFLKQKVAAAGGKIK